MTKQDTITINISDWIEKLEEILRDETVSFDSEQDIINTLILSYGLTSKQAGEVIIAAKQLEILPDDIKWPEHKLNLSYGGSYSTRMMLRAAVESKKLENGKVVNVRQVIGDSQLLGVTQAKDELENQSEDVTQMLCSPYVLTQSTDGIERSKNYLLNVIPGHIYDRLSELAGQEDIKMIAKELKKKIDVMVKELS